MGEFLAKFWGVRGSCPVSDLRYSLYGGNTSCVEVNAGGHLIIIDAGTGIVPLGQELAVSGKIKKINLFLSHFHFDHIQGLPFFKPGYIKDFKIDIYGHGEGGRTLGEIVEGFMVSPYFPVTFNTMTSEINMFEINAGDEVSISNCVGVKAFSLNHPDGCTGYRIEYGGKSVCYASDYEMDTEGDRKLIENVRDTDLLIIDAPYGEREFNLKNGWGHSTWKNAVKIARASNVKKLVLFHHEMLRTDDEQSEIEEMACKEFYNTCAAREGMVVSLL